MAENQNEPNWERGVLERLALATLAEQRRARRWGIFFKLLTFAYLAAMLWMLGDWGEPESLADGHGHTALVSIEGEIAAETDASAEHIIGALQAAFDDKATRGVVLRINSPGGSPVQAGMIFDEIRRLRALHSSTPVIAVVEDICASGGYYVAAAADRIFVDKASVVGSIGVLMDGFGFTGAMNKLGVERRLLTAGTNKGFLDPFSPRDSRQLDHAKVLLADIHQQFIAAVRDGRGQRLKETEETFSGLMWTGVRSVEMGLSDGLGTVDSVARDVIKAPDVRDFTMKQNFAERFAKRLGANMGEALVGNVMQTRLR
jgi:protease-4